MKKRKVKLRKNNTKKENYRLDSLKSNLTRERIIVDVGQYEADGEKTLQEFEKVNEELKYVSNSEAEEKALSWYASFVKYGLSDFNFFVCLDERGYTTKPQQEEIKKISNRIANNIKQCNLEDFKKKVGNQGYPFCCGIFANIDNEINGIRRRKANFCWQQVWALDFDEGITFEEFIQRAIRYNIEPHFVYKTLSCNDEKLNKFRAVWVADFVCTHTTVAESIAKLLMTIFPESDKACKDASRVFFGGKGIIYENGGGYLARLDLLNLVNAVQQYVQDSNYKHRLEQMQDISIQTHICINNGLLDVKMLTIPNLNAIKLEKSKLGLENSRIYWGYALDFGADEYSKQIDSNILKENGIIYILIRKVDYAFNKWYVLRMNFDNLRRNNNSKKVTQKVYKVKSNFEYSIQKEQVRGIKKENIEKKCLLCKEFFTDEYLCFDELLGICTNFINIEGGLGLFQDRLKDSQYNVGRSTDWQVHSEIVNKQRLYPTRCEKFCKYSMKCKHGKNIIETVKTKRNRVVVIDKLKLISLEEGQERLKDIVKGVFENE